MLIKYKVRKKLKKIRIYYGDPIKGGTPLYRYRYRLERPLREREVAGSNPGRVIPKTLKMVLVAPLLTLAIKG